MSAQEVQIDLRSLDDPDAPIFTMGQASSLLGIEVGAMRRLDAVSGESRSSGNQRRYSRRDLERLKRIHDVMQEGISIAGAIRIVDLENQVGELQQDLAEEKDKH